TSTTNVERYQRIRHRILGRSFNSCSNKRRMFNQPQEDNGPSSKTRFQVEPRKEHSRTNSINHFPGIGNRLIINETSRSKREEIFNFYFLLQGWPPQKKEDKLYIKL
ncbi:hypothetical protein ACTA71_009074, partial [Dictyostelium dimigraforme]